MPKKRSQDKISIHFEAEEHDEKTCFRCRLHKLFDELKNKNDPEFILFCLAEASGSLLAQEPSEAKIDFIMMLKRSYEEERDSSNEEDPTTPYSRFTTKH
jgi:hypothetical protein